MKYIDTKAGGSGTHEELETCDESNVEDLEYLDDDHTGKLIIMTKRLFFNR